MNLKNKHKLLIANFATLLVGGILLTHFSYAWINHNRYVDKIELQTGAARAQVAGFMFRKLYSGTSGYVNQSADIEATQLPGESGQLYFTFIDTLNTVFTDLSLNDLYLDEHTLNSVAIPSYFVELQFASIVPLSYIRLTMKQLTLEMGEPVPSFNDFAYRYAIVSQSSSSPLDFVTPSQVSTLQGNTLNTVGHDIVLDEASTGQITLAIPSGEEVFYADNFIKSIVIELTPHPLLFIQFLQNNTSLVDTNLLIGSKLAFDFEYSLVSFGD